MKIANADKAFVDYIEAINGSGMRPLSHKNHSLHTGDVEIELHRVVEGFWGWIL